jgi:hypothetical protein
MKGFREFIGESHRDHELPLIIGDLEVWPEDLSEMTWYEARAEVAKLGPGWRLPTLDEFKEVIYPNREKIHNIANDGFYWSSAEADDTDNAWTFSFTYSNGSGYYYDWPFKYTYCYLYKKFKYCVRPVRDFNADTAIEYVFKDF